LVQFFEELATRFAQMSHLAFVEGLKQRHDCTIGFTEAEKGAIAQGRQHPALHVLNAILGVGFITLIPNSE